MYTKDFKSTEQLSFHKMYLSDCKLIHEKYGISSV